MYFNLLWKRYFSRKYPSTVTKIQLTRFFNRSSLHSSSHQIKSDLSTFVCSFFSLFLSVYPSLLCGASSTRALNGNKSLWSEVHLWVITRPGTNVQRASKRVGMKNAEKKRKRGVIFLCDLLSRFSCSTLFFHPALSLFLSLEAYFILLFSSPFSTVYSVREARSQ